MKESIFLGPSGCGCECHRHTALRELFRRHPHTQTHKVAKVKNVSIGVDYSIMIDKHVQWGCGMVDEKRSDVRLVRVLLFYFFVRHFNIYQS